jgi:DNA-binding NarL/FixJ family response regulator
MGNGRAAAAGDAMAGDVASVDATASTTTAWRRRLLLVEDERLLASLMVEVLRGAGFEVVHATGAVEARDLLDEFDPDAALVDVHLGPGPSGLHLGHVIARTHPHVGVLLLSRFADLSAAGIDGWELPPGSVFLPKDRIVETAVLIDTVESVLAGRPAPTGDEHGLGPLAALTRAQLSVLRLATAGLNNAAIAGRRGTTERSVEQHLQGVYASLGIPVHGEVNPRVEAVLRYVEVAGLPVGPDPDTLDDGPWEAAAHDDGRG